MLLLAGGLSTFELELMGATSPCARRGARGRDANLAEMRPFTPNPEVLRRFASDTTDIGAVQEVMCNVYAFVLAFAAYELSGVEATLVGRKLRLELDQPTDAAAELALDAAIDSEFNNNLRRALTVLVKEMVEMMEKDAEKTEGLGFAI